MGLWRAQHSPLAPISLHTHPCQTLGLFKCRITLTSLKVQFCSHLLGKQSFFPCGLSQLGAG